MVVTISAAVPVVVKSKSRFSAPYPEPPEVILTLVTAPPATTTLANAPSQTVELLSNTLTFWYVPFVYPEPPLAIVAVTIPLRLWFLSNVRVAVPFVAVANDVDTPVIVLPIWKLVRNLSRDSLVRLFLKSSVVTSPNGERLA